MTKLKTILNEAITLNLEIGDTIMTANSTSISIFSFDQLDKSAWIRELNYFVKERNLK